MSTTIDWMPIIHRENPYFGFPPDRIAPDMQGWGSESPIFDWVIANHRARKIVEVGSWKGASAIRLANLIKKEGGRAPEAQLICVDTWLGSVEHWLDRDDPRMFNSLNLRWGIPQLYYQFVANVVHSGNQDMIIPFPTNSLVAARFLAEKQIYADAIYIDAGHTYDDVIADLNSFWQIVRPGGVIFGDDYHPRWNGVVNAVKVFADQHSLSIDASFPDKYLIVKPP
jgi:SAM-dependent methyltransferase